MDIAFTYEIGDMVKFTLLSESENIFTGVISERWGGNKIEIYRINCMEKGMTAFTVSSALILEKIA